MSGPKYPNQQLRQVSLEAFFPGQLGALGGFGRVQDLFKQRLPHLFVPNINSGDPAALRPFLLADDGRQSTLSLAVNQVAFSRRRYPGYAAFKADAIPTISAVLRELAPDKLTRVVYRYENEVGVPSDQGVFFVDQFFPGILPAILSERTRVVNSNVESSWSDDVSAGSEGFQAQLEESPFGFPVLKINIFATVENITIAELESAADRAHERAFTLFEKAISTSFKSFISQATP